MRHSAQQPDMVHMFVRAGEAEATNRQVTLVSGSDVPLVQLDLPPRLRGQAREQVALRQLSDKLGLKPSLAKGGSQLNFGAFGLKALQPERITARQIEAARRTITRSIKRQGRVWIRVFPDVPVSTKPAEVRQGKGKGSPEYWACRVKPGRILFELDGVPEAAARQAFALAAAKLPIKTKFVQRIGGEA